MDIRIGCSGFPVSMKEYFGSLGFVELEKTFHAMPSIGTARRWRREAPRDFEFALTAPKEITSGAGGAKGTPFDLSGGGLKAWAGTLEVADVLNAKVIVFRTPLSFGSSDAGKDNMMKFFSSVERAGRTMVWDPQGEWPENKIHRICGGGN